MNSKVIKFVAGGGKTTYCLDYLKNKKFGLYLAFNNSVVDSVQERGFLARTIDSFFQSFLIPKFLSDIPIIAKGAEIGYLNTDGLPDYLKGVGQYNIHSDGSIYYKNSFTDLTLNYDNVRLHADDVRHAVALRRIFTKNSLQITDNVRAGLSSYLINTFGQRIVSFVKSRFSYVIIDEAQDLSDYKEGFAKLLFESDLDLIVLGDDKQNIYGRGKWFESLAPDEERKHSYRCPERNCEWIRTTCLYHKYSVCRHLEQ